MPGTKLSEPLRDTACRSFPNCEDLPVQEFLSSISHCIVLNPVDLRYTRWIKLLLLVSLRTTTQSLRASSARRDTRENKPNYGHLLLIPCLVKRSILHVPVRQNRSNTTTELTSPQRWHPLLTVHVCCSSLVPEKESRCLLYSVSVSALMPGSSSLRIKYVPT